MCFQEAAETCCKIIFAYSKLFLSTGKTFPLSTPRESGVVVHASRRIMMFSCFCARVE